MRTSIGILFLSLSTFTAAVIAQTSDKSVSTQVNQAAVKSTPSHTAKVDVETTRAKARALRKVTEQKPGTKEACDASIEEVQTLAKLANLQDAELEQRRHDLVEQLKKDEAIPRPERAKLSSLSANVDVGANHSLDPDQRMAAFAEVAWNQLKEFPDNTENYAALLRIARDSNDRQAKKIAEGLLKTDAPAEVKAGAQVLLARIDLVGKSLEVLLGNESQQLGFDSPVTLFTWSASQPNALNLTKALQQAFPGDTIIAICLDSDAGTAKAATAQQKTDAQLIFPEAGKDSPLCKRLLLDGPAVYRVNKQGMITTVSGLNQLSVAHWQRKAKEAKK